MENKLPTPDSSQSTELSPPAEVSQESIDSELAAKMAAKSDFALQDMFESPADWRPEALAAAKAELDRRNVPVQRNEETAAPPVIEESPRVRPGIMCVQHPRVQATQQCRRCGAFMCPTCDFAFPNDFHFCPVCVAKPEDALSGKRKKFMVWSFVLAAWSTVGMTCLVSGALGGIARTKGDEAVLGWVLILFVLGPAITGMSLGLTSRRKKGANPAPLWIAIIWNVVLVASFVVLMLIGISRR